MNRITVGDLLRLAFYILQNFIETEDKGFSGPSLLVADITWCGVQITICQLQGIFIAFSFWSLKGILLPKLMWMSRCQVNFKLFHVYLQNISF